MSDIDNSEDYLDVRDIIERFEELESELETAHEEAIEEDADPPCNLTFDEWVEAVRKDAGPAHQHELWDEVREYQLLKELLDDLKGYGGDHQWLGDWYPVTLIRHTYFVESMQEMVEECFLGGKELPDFIEIDWDKTAENLRQDYNSVDFDGVEYWYR